MAEVVELVLDDGTPHGLMIANIPNWVGVVVSSPRALLDRLKTRTEVHRAGIYLLAGPDPEIDGATQTYIGEGDKIWDRISDHHRNKDFWNIVIGITTTTAEADLSKSHIRYLEAKAIAQIKEIGRATLSQNAPKLPKINESMRIFMDTFYDKMIKLLPLLGYPYLTPIIEKSTSNENDGSFVFMVESKGVKARAVQTNSELVVLKGSQASKEDAPSWTSGKTMRNRLIMEGALKDIGACLEFTRDVSFNSPSQASNIVLARQTPGPITWKEVESGKTYKEIFSELTND
tara:strand:+ start:136 stop:1002 length:867 start_codon:yes stop_codon:yes gene_type:complete